MMKPRPCNKCGRFPKYCGATEQTTNGDYVVIYLQCSCGNATGSYRTVIEIIEAWNKEFGKPITNREWLESSSDEEFSKYIICRRGIDNPSCRDYVDCRECIGEWLKSEHRDVS